MKLCSLVPILRTNIGPKSAAIPYLSRIPVIPLRLDRAICAHYFAPMRPLYHPPASDITIEGIFHALADPNRMQIFADIARAAAPQVCSVFLNVTEKPIPKSTLSQHFRVLREAGLIRSERTGVELHNTVRFREIEQRFGPLLSSILDAFDNQTRHARVRTETAEA